MSPAQREALERAGAASEPITVAAATARILHERYGYLEPNGDGWSITPRGRSLLAGQKVQAQRQEIDRMLPMESRQWGERVVAWLEAHARFRRYNPAFRYAGHVAACDHAGIEPVCAEHWPDKDCQWVEREARAAATCLRDYDDAEATARARSVGVSVTYEADEKVPRSRREAAEQAAAGDVVSLRTYRERRPGRDGGAA